MANETRRLVANTSDAQFLAGLEDLLAAAPQVLGEIISQTIVMATDHLRRHIEKSVNILVGKAVQIRQQVLKEKLRRVAERSLREYGRESLDILRGEMEKQTPSAP
jgi:hypothetical protein